MDRASPAADGPSPLPDRADVVVIGAGIAGVCAAYYLAKAGKSVVVCEKGRIAGEQSSRNWGFVRQQGRDPGEIPTIIESIRLWKGLREELGEDLGFEQRGTLYLADDEEAVASFEAWLEHARDYQIDTRLLTRAEVLERLPGTTGHWIAGMTTGSDGRAEPSLAVPAIARGLRRLGGIVVENLAVRGLQRSGGRVSGVVTEMGEIAADAVLLAGGAWSGLFCARHGITLPQLKTRSSVFRTGPAPEVTEHAVWCRDVAFRRRRDGGYSVAHGAASEAPVTADSIRFLPLFWKSFQAERRRLRIRLDHRFWEELTTPRRWSMAGPSPFEETRVLDPRPSRSILAEASANLRRLFPQLRDVPIAETWAGMIDVMPDAVPVIGPVAGHDGLYLSTGFSGHGFGIGPGAGKLAAEIVMGGPTTVDPSPFRVDRFGV